MWQEAIDFYFFKDVDTNPALTNYGCKWSQPYHVIVGRDGLLKVVGSNFDYEEKINDYLGISEGQQV